MDIPILYEDDQVVVIDKPSGVICNKAETVKSETLQDWMISTARIKPLQVINSHKRSDEEYFYERAGLVHRLDKETSGVMVFSKTPESFFELLRQFKEREVVKEYLALTHGVWGSKAGIIDMPIGRRQDNRQLMGVREQGRESLTEYRVLDEYKVCVFAKELKVDKRGYTGFSLVSFIPKTGRTHQIRVHAKAVGHSLVGDVQYGGRKRSREDRKWAPRVMLQAQELEFRHPKSRERVKFVSQNREFRQIMSVLSN